jgi:hypothetical protein
LVSASYPSTASHHRWLSLNGIPCLSQAWHMLTGLTTFSLSTWDCSEAFSVRPSKCSKWHQT